MEQDQKPQVGIEIMVLKDGRVLLGKRTGSHGAGEYAFPGGHLEYMETFNACAKRELAEETGVEMANTRFLMLANVTKYAPKHYTHITLIADWKSGEPKVLEPEVCESWAWYDIDNLPEPLFETCRLSIDSYKTGKNYYDGC